MRPMLATRGDQLPEGDRWCHEVKWDGMRVLAEVAGGVPRLWSRNENDVTVSFPELARIDTPDVLLDGEVVALADGRPDFGALSERMHQRRPDRAAALVAVRPVTFLVFDVLTLEGRSLLEQPLERRRAVLEGLDLASASVQVPPTYDDGAMLQQVTAEHALEGVVSKRWDSRYVPGSRSRHWLKFPHRPSSTWVVGGWRPETGSTGRLGSLLVGERAEGGLRFRGRVGSGVAGRASAVLRELLEPLASDACPFVDGVPRVDAQGARWVRPELHVEVESLGFSRHDRLRQPAYRGLRPDLGGERVDDE